MCSLCFSFLVPTCEDRLCDAGQWAAWLRDTQERKLRDVPLLPAADTQALHQLFACVPNLPSWLAVRLYAALPTPPQSWPMVARASGLGATQAAPHQGAAGASAPESSNAQLAQQEKKRDSTTTDSVPVFPWLMGEGCQGVYAALSAPGGHMLATGDCSWLLGGRLMPRRQLAYAD